MFKSLATWRRLHLWLSVLLSLQLLAWFGSGLLMSAFDINEVRGNLLRKDWPAADWSSARIAPQQLVPTTQAAAGLQLSLTQRAELPVYLLQGNQGERYIDAQSGKELAPLSPEQATALALTQYQGEASVQQVQWLTQVPLEARGLSAPLFRVDFSDDVTFYLHPVTGQVQRVRTPLWRAYDFAWMLHIMDYQERENSHNPLLIASSITALGFTLSGIVLLVLTLKRRRRSV